MHASTLLAALTPLLAFAAAEMAPPGFVLTFTGYTTDNTCTGHSYTKNYTAGKCFNLPAATMSWSSVDHPDSAEVEMNLYGQKNCIGAGGTEHLDADGDCFDAQALFVGVSVVNSLCIGCD